MIRVGKMNKKGQALVEFIIILPVIIFIIMLLVDFMTIISYKNKLESNMNNVTILYKGANKADAAAFYAPYTPVSFTKVTHQESGAPAVILMSRYGIAANPVSPETYVRSFKVNFTDIKCLS